MAEVRKRNVAAAGGAPGVQKRQQVTQEKMMKIASWLRGYMEVGQGVLFDQHRRKRRVDYFCGKDFKEALQSTTCTKKGFLPNEVSDVDVDEIGTMMLHSKVFFRSVITNLDSADLEDLDELDAHRQQTFLDDDDEIFSWILKPSNTELYMKSAGLVVCVLSLCMIKIWPLWLKIFIWWCSLILLICMTAILVLRLVLYVFASMVGLKGIWLFPNFLEEVDFLDAFQPLFGRGIDRKQYERAQMEAIAASRRKHGKDSEKADDADADADTKEEEADAEPLNMKLAIRNLVAVLILGAIICYFSGLFHSDNIPDFVVSQVELWKEFPSLAPPDFDLDAHEANKTAEQKKNKPGLDDILADIADDEEEEEYKVDPILDRVDDQDDDIDDLDMPDVPDDDEEEEQA